MAKHRYEVVGPHRVAGHESGSTFTHDFPAELEQRLVEAGHIKRVTTNHKAKKEASDGSNRTS